MRQDADAAYRSSMNRREFLAAAAAPLAAGARSWGGRDPVARARVAGDLPPRVVGLRSLGGDFVFDPAGIRIGPGETLRWLNIGDFHTATAFHPRYEDLVEGNLPLRIPEEAEPWHSGMLGLTDGTRFRHAFTVEGVHDYFCQPHYGFGMVGRVVVGDPGTGPGTRPLEGVPSAALEQMPSLDRILGPRGRRFEWAARLNGVLYLRDEGEPAAPAARAVRDAVADDAELREHLGASRFDELAGAIDGLVRGVENGLGFRDLLTRADRAKRLARPAGGPNRGTPDGPHRFGE